MNIILAVRVFILLLSILCGYYMGSLFPEGWHGEWIGVLAGILFALSIFVFELKLMRVSLRTILAGILGMAFGFFTAGIFIFLLRMVPIDPVFYTIFQMICVIAFCYLGMVIGVRCKDDFAFIIPYVKFARKDKEPEIFIVDTTVIVDGRILGICEIGFLKGKFVIPRFVIEELQDAQDSSDEIKRSKGKRGLEILNLFKAMPDAHVIIYDDNFSHIREIDAKLLKLAKVLQAAIITNDFNVNKTAKIECIRVLNINDLAGALRPLIFAGDEIAVQIKKEGKEKNQGVAFMDDGTMVVVDNARKYIGRKIPAIVTSIIQTQTGRMIFAGIKERHENGQGNGHGNGHGNTNHAKEKDAAENNNPAESDGE
ncbi:PilT protein domain-containing protein [Candidatus Omnitrophus magneticus]|uniref:PilT protein domain-containing protein n=1 Tax=Candidatus Omnitrophus magneticus TaxID=1609969 RepID=A0A0F0CRK7_9BACT|nr:PilT protein domain-containing protein [Candidatus Omnitrophus magneticus]